jgi:hypothetical protein
MKQNFKQGDNLMLGFLLSETHEMFITPFPSLKSG